MKVSKVNRLQEKFIQCDITTSTGNFYIVGDRSHYLVHNSPALICGRNADGQFIMTDKAGWGAKGYNGHYTSPKQFIDQKLSKAKGDSDSLNAYLTKIKALWPLMEKVFPKNYRGFIMGDVLWFPGDMKDNGHRFVFTPNTVTYEVNKNSDIGHRIASSKAGFAVHTFIEAPGAEGSPLQDTSKLNLTGAVCILGPEIKNEAPVQQDKTRITFAKNSIKKYAKSIDSFLNQATLAELKMTGLPDILYNYVNQQVRTKDISRLYLGFLNWVQSNPKISRAMVSKITEYCKANDDGIKAIFLVFDIITELKHDIINQLDSFDGPIKAHIAGVPGGEGYVNADPAGNVKYVNRLNFSATNALMHSEDK